MVATIYEQMPADADQALADYFQLGPDRSLGRLAEQYRARGPQDAPPPTRRHRTLSEWSVRYHWQQRIALMQQESIMRARDKTAERLSDVSIAAADTLFRMLDATKTVVSPTGGVHTVPDNDVQLKAAMAILDRVGLSPAMLAKLELSGPGGGPIPVLAATVDVSKLTADELMELLRSQVTGG